MNSSTNKFKTILLIVLLASSFAGFSQKNSPWKKLTEQTTSGVFFGLGRHLYSLSSGQYFALYLKNYNAMTVKISGKIVAKTTCGTEIVVSFTNTLVPNQEASGDSTNGQVGVVTVDDCVGKKRFLNPKVAVTNRILDIVLRDVQVQTLDGAFVPTDAPLTAANAGNTMSKVSNKVSKFSDIKLSQDSLLGVIEGLRIRNRSLQDSITNLNSFLLSKGMKR